MFTVYAHDDLVVDYVVVFEGTEAECEAFVAEEEKFFGELYIEEPFDFD